MCVPNETISHRANQNIIRLTNTPRYNKLMLLVVDRIRAVPVIAE